VAVVFVGLPEDDEVEGLDRDRLDLPAAHDALVEAVASRHPRVVVVVCAGAPVVMPWRDRVCAIAYGYLGGEAGGGSLADVLTGHSEPGGRLAETLPVRLSDNPVHAIPFGPQQTEYRESVYVGYRWYDSAGVDVAYPFGHGLSYTTFAWSRGSAQVFGDSTVEVAITITNTGERAGSEVLQVYVHDVTSTVFRPAQELKGFAKVDLGPGQSRRVTLRLQKRAFAFWDVAHHDWTIEAGAFEIRLAASSRDIRAVLPVTIAAHAVDALVSGPPSYHDLTPASRFERADFAAVYGKPLADNVIDKPGAYTVNTPIADMRHPAARALLRVLRVGARRAFRGRTGSPGWQLVEATIAVATPRMLSMFIGHRFGDPLARVLVRWANRTRR
jgi:beta-glucosidase